MSISLPELKLFYTPILEFYDSVDEAHYLDCKWHIIEKLKLTDEQIHSQLENGYSRLGLRITWVQKYLKVCKLIETTKRATISITEEGKVGRRRLLNNNNKPFKSPG